MSNFHQGGNRNKGNGGGSFNKSWGRDNNRGFGGDRREVTMHDAVCDKCGNNCKVPFKPSGDKPLYCNDCFGAKRDQAPERGTKDRYISTPRAATSVFSPANSTTQNYSNNTKDNSEDMKKQLENIVSKLDKLTQILEAKISLEQEAKNIVSKVSVPVTIKPVVKKEIQKTVKKVSPKVEVKAKPVVKAAAKKKK